MDLSEFQDLPDEAQVWVHCFEQELSEQQQETIQRGLAEFLPQWVSHGTPVQASLHDFVRALCGDGRLLPGGGFGLLDG